MGKPILVSENLERIAKAEGEFSDQLSALDMEQNELDQKHHENLGKLDDRRQLIKDEMNRLEGCRITFEGFAQVGIEVIKAGDDHNSHNHNHNHQDHQSNDEHLNTIPENGSNYSSIDKLYSKYRTM